MSLSEWLLDVGSPDTPVLVDSSGTLTRDEQKIAVTARAIELAELPGAVIITGDSDRNFVLNYLAALDLGRRVYLPHASAGMPDGAADLAAARSNDYEQQAAVVMYTSGSTSKPSLVPLTQNNLIANGSAIVGALGIHDADRILCTLPFNYSFGLSLLHSALASGGCAILLGQTASIPDILRAISTYHVTVIGLVPTLARRLARRVDVVQPARSLRMVQVAGSRLDVDSTHALTNAFDGRVSLQIMYGLTEATARVTAFDATQYPAKIGSCGQPIPQVTVHCEDVIGEKLNAGQEGTVVVGGPGICSAYARSDGLLQTGDYGLVDIDGFLWIQGRIGAFAKIGDIRVSLALVEDFLHAQPGVAHAVALAIPHPVYTERIVALVVPDERGTNMSRLREAINDNIPRLLIPSRIDLVHNLPMTRNGKIDRLAASVIATNMQKEQIEF